MNRLAQETSLYLQQHAGNPVEWHAWGREALDRARREDKPILLSIGYSACHWCHVMAHESFEDPGVAAVMNRLFVNVKVDREERPDLDQIYQAAHQMLAQRPGGWPLTMFLTPDGAPFFGGTYFPKTPRYGMPGFPELCERVAGIWREKRAEIAAQNAAVLKAFERMAPVRESQPPALSVAPTRTLLDSLRASFDARFGGFGGAPKFPHPTDLDLCLRQGETGIAQLTLTRMCEGGIYDQLGGGFCRYSTDAQWLIPHFEKMLYDNGLLLQLLADAWQVTRQPLYARCAAGTAGWLMREMQSPQGGYYSSLDADSEGEEGRFYVWHSDEVKALLTDEEYREASAHFGLDLPPNFENKHWHLRISSPEKNRKVLEEAKKKLFREREKRIRPGRDEKILVAWNALAISGMARAGRVFQRADWVASARRAFEFIRAAMGRDGRLLFLDDYAFLIAALLELLQDRFSVEELQFTQRLAEVLLERFEDAEQGGFFFTARDHERLIHRPKPGQDQATPSGNAIAARALARLSALTGEPRYVRAAERTLELFYPAMLQQPGGFGAMATALGEQLEPPRTLVLRGESEALQRWQAELAGDYAPDLVTVAIVGGMAGLPAPLDKPQRETPVSGWLCRGATCLPPISDLVKLKKILKEKA
jgi:uncharacterized protein